MFNVRTDIATRVQPLVRLADWSCMSAIKQGPRVQLEAGLIRKARV
jgi:hypothetical protein